MSPALRTHETIHSDRSK